MEEEEEEALRTYCRRMISHVLKKQHLDSEQGERRRRREKHKEPSGERGKMAQPTPTELSARRVEAGDGPRDHSECNLPLPEPAEPERYEREGALTSPGLVSQGPAAQLVPPRLISLLKHKTFKEEMRRAVEVELHDPAVCDVCEQKQASLALNTFIRRKKTQLEVQTLEDRLNTQLCYRDNLCLLGEFVQNLPQPSNSSHRIWEELLGRDMRVTATLATSQERCVALATDEMRGYPDRNATGTHLARPRCPFFRQIAADMKGTVLI